MRLASILSHVALHSLLDAAGDKLAKWIDDYCRNPTQALPKAMAEANRQTWRAVELALAGDRLLGQLRQRLASGLHQGALAPLNTWLDRQPAGFRAECLAELQAARKAELLEIAFGQELARMEDGLERCASSAAVIDQAHRAMAAGAEGLRSEYPRLASLLEHREAGGPLLVALFGYFLNQAIGHDKELREELDFKHLRQLWQGQNEGFQALHQLLAELGEELAAAFAALATHIDGRFDRLEGGLADLQAEIRQLFEGLRQPGPASPRLTQLIQDPRERQAVRQLMQRYRALPEAQRRRWPELINELGKLQMAAGELDEAERLFQEAANAEGHYNRYRVFLEERRWEEALAELLQAAEADPVRFAPFPLAKYPPQRILGAGGFGVAFLCQHAHLRHPVVVKSLHATDLERNVADIMEEGRTLKTLRHPAIIQVDDSDYADPGQQRPYLVLEHFADSQSLGAYLEAHGPLPLTDSLAIARPVAEALAAAHQAGILHRDLKPDNILVKREATGRWQVKLIDFGMALRQKLVKESLATSSFQHSLLGQSLGGTYRFAAPEQLGLRPEPVGPYSDVYAFGKTIAFALCQKTELNRRDWKRLEQENEAFAELLENCLEPEPQKRPQTFPTVLERLLALDSETEPQWNSQQQQEQARRQQEQERQAEAKRRAEEVERQRQQSEQAQREEQSRERQHEEERRQREEEEAKRRQAVTSGAEFKFPWRVVNWIVSLALLVGIAVVFINRNTEKAMQEGDKIAHSDACMVLPLAMADYIDKLSTSILDNAINQNSGKLGHLSGWSHISMTASKGQKAGQYRLEINTDMGNPGKESRSVFPQIISINLKAEDKKLSIASISTGNVSANGSSNLRQALSETMQLPELPDRVGSSSKTNWAIEFALGNNGHCTTNAYMRALTTPRKQPKPG